MNHSKASTQDRLALLAELEHKRYHNIRTAKATKDPTVKFKRAVWANQAQSIRRDLMAKWFPDLSELDWCDVKVSARIEQLAFELFDGDMEMLERILNLCDDSLSEILKTDLHSCEACAAEQQKTDPEESV